MSATIMGILNVTPDSFSDGGLYTCPSKAVEFAHDLQNSGANIIDVGGQSSRPNAEPISVEVELSRVLPVVEGIHRELHAGTILGTTRTSIDTYYPEVARAACEAGASIINDISGFTDPEMVKVAAGTGADCVLMHMAGEPRTMQDNPFYIDVVQEVCDYLLEGAERLVEAGIPKERIFLDSGYGFGKTKDHNLELFLHSDKMAEQIHAAGYKMLVGISRKSFIGSLFGIDDPQARDELSAELAAALAVPSSTSSVDVLRVHNVALTKQALKDLSDSINSAQTTVAYIALGSNLGGPVANIAEALCAMDNLPLTSVKEIATPVLSEPAYDSNQMPFTNTVCRIETYLPASALFAYLQAIEVDMGREKLREKGPRIIDLDLLSYGDSSIDLPKLKVPHPRMAERAFVLEPLQEIAADFTLPDGSKLVPADEVYGTITTTIPMELLQSEIDRKKELAIRLAKNSQGRR